ncbi:hypothetical protein PTKIN_Ptkin16aG0475500 [Pterospermum kingtungense]
MEDIAGRLGGMGADRKLRTHCRRQRWADKAYKKSNLGNEWKKPFAEGAVVARETKLCGFIEQEWAQSMSVLMQLTLDRVSALERHRWTRLWQAHVPHIGCGKPPETMAHALRGCEVDAQNLSLDELQQFIILAWVTWTGRNQEYHGKGRTLASRTVDFAWQYIQEFNMEQGSPMSGQRSRPVVCWIPPEGTVYKVNFDGALQVRVKVGGIGVIIRNSMGEVMGVMACPINEVSDPLVLEALAAIKALKFANDMGFQ